MKTLVETVSRRGDLRARVDDPTTAREGIRAQKACQQGCGEGYEREVAVTHSFEADNLVLEIAGRADGCDLTPPTICVEEFKATRSDPTVFENAEASVHWAQLETYGAILSARTAGCEAVRLSLIYVHPETFVQHRQERHVEAVVLQRQLTDTCSRFARQLGNTLTHRATRDRDLDALSFPFGELRPAQRRLANAAFRAFRDEQHLLAEAATGGGKTLGCVFPALKALSAGHLDRFVVLSSRTTGQHAVEEAVDLCMNSGSHLRSITVTAKEKVCLRDEMDCDPTVCRYAAGYYDRRDTAVAALLDSGARLDAGRIIEAGREHEVCPFELSLDVAQWCDLIIGDYNYVFDPVTRLNRLRGPVNDRTAVLVDEAHQLGDRVRAMLSATISRGELKSAAACAPETIRRRINAVDRCLLALRRTAVDAERGAPFEVEIEPPEPLHRAIARFLDTAATTREAGADSPEVRMLIWSASRFRRALDWLPEASRTVILRGAGRRIDAELRAIDPAPHIGETLAGFPASVRFSATLAPLALTNRQHGLGEAPTLRLPSSFDADQLGVFAVPDISTLYRDRQRSLDALVELIERFVRAQHGNYLIVFPSFAYLAEAADRFSARFPHRELLTQQPNMNDAERAAFLDPFRAAEDDNARVGFVVMGGIFAESVDLPGDALIGMVIVGIGLPPPDLERRCIERAFHDEGRAVAFDQPAMTRVVQAAGRLLRTDTDRAALCLVDPRYLHDRYTAYFPPLWNVQVTAARCLDDALEAFWSRDTQGVVC